jgi:isopentenyldiphosphate isomerase
MADLYQIVDEDDNLIGLRPRGHEDFKKHLYRISSLWLTNPRGEILIALRFFSKDNDPGKWAPAVAGTLEENETYEENIYKEAEEEIGLKGVKFTPGPKIKQPGYFYCQWYIAKTDTPESGFVLQEDEVEAIKWISKDHLIKDVKEHPEEYVPTMADILSLFLETV